MVWFTVNYQHHVVRKCNARTAVGAQQHFLVEILLTDGAPQSTIAYPGRVAQYIFH